MPQPHVTVVVPALNAGAWIGAALQTVVAQTYPKNRLDVVVVDDGSSDDTAVVAARTLAGSGIAFTVLRHDAPQGPSAARNRGWRHGLGEWVQFLDADDLLEPSKIEVQAEATLNATTDVAVIFSSWARLVDGGERWVAQTPCVTPVVGSDPLLDVLRAENFIQLGSALFARTWLEQSGGFNESCRLIEDVDLLMRIVMHGGVLCGQSSAGPLSWYRQRPGSLSRSSDRAFIEGCLRNARTAEAHWCRHDAITPGRAALLAGVYFMGARFFAEHDPTALAELTQTIYRLQPRFLPDGPPALRLLTRVLGYERAERCAVAYRRMKRSLRGTAAAGTAALWTVPGRGTRL